jgi:hypothetical protein
MYEYIGKGNNLNRKLEKILKKVNIELRESMNRKNVNDDKKTDPPSDKTLVRLHKQVITDTHTLLRNIYCFTGTVRSGCRTCFM